MPEEAELRERVRTRYANAARQFATEESAFRQADGCACCAQDPALLLDASGAEVFGASLYADKEEGHLGAPLQASLGCGVPTAVADLREGEVVLDLGSGAGADVLISARRVGPTGKAIGIDMTQEMLELARRNASVAGVTNVEFLEGYLEALPLEDESVDVVISNCVINLAADKQVVLREAARVLRRSGRLAVSDVVADPDMDQGTRSDMELMTGCVAGALTKDQYLEALDAAGFGEVEVVETHRVHEHAAAAIIRARRVR
ncbi:MAG: arsenite methyltransferase [Candidatus Dormibacteraeota bacterium]|nr:arsenite methyltransferase [Candidatus Dormibacteraeota bacterium]